MLKIVEKAKIWIAISLIVIIVGLGFIFFKGLNFGIDFKGGTQVVIQLKDNFDKQEVDNIAKKYTNDISSNIVEGNQYELRSSSLNSESVGKLVEELKEKYKLDENPLISQDEIGASIGNDLKKNSIIAVSIAFIAMLIYVAIRFELYFGIAALITLIHDVLITLSVYAIFDIQINTPFIAAILTIIGYSINDTIVIFDRIRENNKTMRKSSIIEITNKSVTQTMSRSINTSLTTLFTIVAVNIFVPSVRDFSAPLVVGIIAGAYSSIFIASPIWVMLRNKNNKQTAIAK